VAMKMRTGSVHMHLEFNRYVHSGYHVSWCTTCISIHAGSFWPTTNRGKEFSCM